MLVEKEWVGKWYLPSFPDDIISGTLKYSPRNGMRLNLIGSLNSEITESIDIILGKDNNNNEVTLINSFVVNNFGNTSSIIVVNHVLVGCHFNDLSNIKFNSITIHSEQIDNWMYDSAINVNHSNNFKDYIVSYKKSDDIRFEIDTETKGYIIPYSLGLKSFRTKLILDECVKVKIKSKIERSFFDLLSLSSQFEDFVAICSSFPVFKDRVVFKSDRLLKKVINHEIEIEVEYYRSQVSWDYLEDSDKFYNYLIPYREIKKSFVQIIEKWFNMRNLMKPISKTLVYDKYRNKFSENNFLNMTQGLESFHSRYRNDDKIPPSEKDSKLANDIIKKIKANEIELNEDEEKFLKKKLLRYRHINLRDRLKQLISEIIEYEFFRFLIKDKDEFINSIIFNRDYHTHYDSNKEDKVLSAGELLYLYLKIKLILTVLVLKESGFNDSEMLLVIKKCKEMNSFLIKK